MGMFGASRDVGRGLGFNSLGDIFSVTKHRYAFSVGVIYLKLDHIMCVSIT